MGHRRELRLEGKKTSGKGSTHLHKGKVFEAHGPEGSGLFMKDIASAGRRIHPGTHEVVDLPRDRLVQFAEDANRWRAAGNKIPFPDGHDESTAANLGFWEGPFFVVDDTLYGIVKPLDALAIQKILDGTLDAVSLATEIDLKDQSGADYEETIVHIAATNYPVVENQGAFVALSQKLDSDSRRCFVPEALALSFKGGEEMDREKAIKKLGLKKDATDLDIIAALQKQIDSNGADLDKKIEASTKKTLEGVTAALAGSGLSLTIEGEKLTIAKPDAAPDETAAEKAVKARLAVLEGRESKMMLDQAAAHVEAAIKAGQLPPGERERVVKLLSIKEKAMSMMLSGTGDPVAMALDVVLEVKGLLEALPKKIDVSQLKQMDTLPPETDAEKEKKKEALSRGKAAMERRKGKKPEPAGAAK